MRARALALCSILAGALASCAGPDAPDAAVCRDAIHRLCLPLPCGAVLLAFGVSTSDCEAALLARSGCASDAYAFPDPPGRERVLECRLALLRAGGGPEQHPDCADVSDFVDLCRDVT